MLSVEEVGRLLKSAPGPSTGRYSAPPTARACACPRSSRRRSTDIDRERMLIRVEQGKGRKDRYAMLSPQLLALLRLWWKEGKRRGVMLPQGWLFPGRAPGDPMSTRQICRAFRGGRAAGIGNGCRPIRCATASPPICSNRMSILGSSKFCSEQPHTARQQPIERRIYYPFHPRCGETVLIQTIRLSRTELVVIPQPDGSVACIPAWMTHETAAHPELCAEPRLSLDIFRSLRSEIDAVLGFLQSDSKVEKDRHEAQNSTIPSRTCSSWTSHPHARASTEGATGCADGSSASRNRSGSGGRGGQR